MIDLIMRFGPEHIFVRVTGANVQFASASSGNKLASIEGLKLDKTGVEKEFPDLKGNPAWRHEAINRFKQKIKSLKTEKAILEYVKDDLKKYGYVPLYQQVAGFRREKLA